MASRKTGPARRARSGSKETPPPAPAPQPATAELATVARGLTEGLSRIGGLSAIDNLLESLRRNRLFPDLVALGAALANQGIPFSPRAQRLTAQGLIELGRFDEAKKALDQIVKDDADADEVLEAHGLIGRIQKQVYVNEAVRLRRDAAMLRSAVQQYLTAFDNHPRRPEWHGVNAAALLVRAARDKVDGLPRERAQAIAGEIRETLLGRYTDQAHYWDLATIAEASLVLDDTDQAELWFHRAAWSSSAEPFALASTLRQLREVWLLDPTTSPGARILPPLDARLHALGQTHMITPSAVAASDSSMPLEKVFGTSPFMPFQAWALGLECAKSVCRVEDKLNQGIGTGFVVNGKLLNKALPDELLLITNAHVMTPKGDNGSLTPAQAHVSFYACVDKSGRPHTSKIKKILFTSPPGALDVTIATLEKRPTVKSPLTLAANLPAADSKQKVFIIGHPSGGGLVFSLNDNELLDHGDPTNFRVHYRTPTEPGSSGSPVFNGLWELIALHHAGDALMERIHGAGKYQANEGIAFKHIGPAIKVR
jgi:tetratricopeptide (TPR) repeat protein